MIVGDFFGDFEPADAFDAGDHMPHSTPASAPRYLTEMADVLAAAGLDVLEVDGWQTRARGSGGYADGRPTCVMWHHTASQTTPENDVNYIVYGCPDAPVANLYLDRAGVVYVCAAGATNTNGTGGPFTVSHGVVPADRMNEYAVSVEMANNGVGERWPRQQVDAMFAISIALTNWLDLQPTDVGTHTAWTTRKIDPATAAAVEGPWQPSAVNSSGSWSLDDIRDELIYRWQSQPPPTYGDLDMYLATLNDGTVCVVGSSVRPVSGDEIAEGGPYGGLPMYHPDPASYWHMWLAAGVAEYSARVMP